MKVIVVKDYEAMSELSAQIIGDMIKNNPSCTLGDRKSTRLNSSHPK